jgi:hypothetical protein
MRAIIGDHALSLCSHGLFQASVGERGRAD